MGYIHYFTLQLGLSNTLLRDTNRERIRKLHPREFDVRTYHIRVHKTIGISSSRVTLRITMGKGNKPLLFLLSTLKIILKDETTTIL